MTEIPYEAYNAALNDLVEHAALAGFVQRDIQQVFSELYAWMERDGLTSRFEPRKICAPQGYSPFKNVACSLFAILREASLKAQLNVQLLPIEVTGLSISYQVLKYGIPVYYVAEEFIRAVAATELPSDFTIEELHWPMPAMVLGFPVKFMQEFIGHPISYVNCATFADDMVCKYPGNEFPNLLEIYVPKAKVAWQFYDVAHGHLESFVSAYHVTEHVNEAIGNYPYTDYTGAPEAHVAADENSLRQLAALVLKLLVILNTRPSLVMSGSIERKLKMKHGKVKHREIWSPSVIGATYRAQRQEPVGTHASPRWHWRKGHLTHQRKGSLKSPDFVSMSSLPRRENGQVDWDSISLETKQKFWACHERKWLEPTLVNFTE